jgi:hypothetical protein
MRSGFSRRSARVRGLRDARFASALLRHVSVKDAGRAVSGADGRRRIASPGDTREIEERDAFGEAD